MTAPALQLTGIRKRFGELLALDGADLVLRRGTVHAVLGENGAGKTTLMRIAFGLTAPDDGTITVDGMRIRTGRPAIRAGIGMVQQHFALVPAMTPLENVALGISAPRRMNDDAERLAAQLGLRLDVDVPVAQLSVPEQQRIELLKALTRGAHILILDEPTAALAPEDADRLFKWLREFCERDGSVVLITHKLREAMAIADDISVLRHGAITWSGPRESASIEGLARAMLGEARPLPESEAAERVNMEARPRSLEPVASADRLEIHDARGVRRVRDATLRVFAGEILGVAGVEGSGSRELLYALAGRLSPIGGDLRLPDEIGFVPEDRQQEALLLAESIADNVALKGAGRRRGWFGRSDALSLADRLTRAGGVRARDVRAPVSTLSGGNQQRLVLARELDGRPPLLVAVNPTRGLDVAAYEEIQQRMRDAARAGMAIVYYTADLDELTNIADRVVVVFDGRVREIARDRDAIGRAMLGAA